MSNQSKNYRIAKIGDRWGILFDTEKHGVFRAFNSKEEAQKFVDANGDMTAHPAPQDGEELRQRVVATLGLEEDLLGQLVLKSYEDVQSNWKFCVDDLMQLFETDKAAAVREACYNEWLTACRKYRQISIPERYALDRLIAIKGDGDAPHPTSTGEDN